MDKLHDFTKTQPYEAKTIYERINNGKYKIFEEKPQWRSAEDVQMKKYVSGSTWQNIMISELMWRLYLIWKPKEHNKSHVFFFKLTL